MTKKPRHGQALQSKKKKKRQPLVAAQVAAPVTSLKDTPAVSAPAAGEPATRAKVLAVKYPYVTSELQRIGILAGAIVVILVVLALVL